MMKPATSPLKKMISMPRGKGSGAFDLPETDHLISFLGRAGLHLDGVAGFLPEEGAPERGLVRNDLVRRIAVPGAEDGVLADRAAVVLQLHHAADTHVFRRNVLEIGHPGPGELALELA